MVGLGTVAVSGQSKHGAADPVAFDLPALGREGRVRLADFRGTPVVVNFFASWCTACDFELRGFAQAADDLRGKVRLVGVNALETGDWREMAERHELEEHGFVLARDTGGRQGSGLRTGLRGQALRRLGNERFSRRVPHLIVTKEKTMFSRQPSTSPAAAAVPSGNGAPTPPGPSPVEVIDDDSFFDRTAGGVTIVDFWAPWCGPCRSFAPIFEQAASDYEGRVRFAKCNVDLSPKTAGLLQIQSIPTLIMFGSDGSELGRVSGVLPHRQLDALIERLAPATQALPARPRGERAV